MSLNIVMKIIRSWNCSFRPFCSWTFGLLGQAPMRRILGKYSTRILSVLRRLCPMFCILLNLWTIPAVVPKQYFMLGSDSSFQDITQNLRIHKPLHARDWWLLHHWPEITVSMENLPSWFEALQKSHTIVPASSVQKSRTFSSKWGFHLYFWWNFLIVWWILHHEHRCFQCRRHKHSPNHRPFVKVLHCIFWRTVQNLSQSVIHFIREWTWFLRKVRFCGSGRVHVNIDDQLVGHRQVSPYLLSTFHQFSALEKTTCRHWSILRSLMS